MFVYSTTFPDFSALPSTADVGPPMSDAEVDDDDYVEYVPVKKRRLEQANRIASLRKVLLMRLYFSSAGC